MILQTRQFYKALTIIIIISITLLPNTTPTHGEDESPSSIMRRTPSKQQTEFFFPLYQNHKKMARRFRIKYSNGQKKQKQEAQGKYEMSTLSLPHTRRYGFDCVFLDFFASSGFGTRIKTKEISNDIFFTTNTLFCLFFWVKSTNPATKQHTNK